jgi:ubiquitin carboxyl-terminal hydrolase 4/11/15
MFTFSRLLQALAGQVTGSEAKKAAPLFRVWTFVPSSLQIKEDGLSAALQKIYLAPDVVRATNSSITVASKMDDSEQTCDDKGLQDGDAFIIELAEATRGATTDPDWVSDRASTPSGNEFVINMPPVPKAPAPLFSKPAAYAGTATSNSLVPEGFGMATRSQRKERDPVKTRGLVGLQNLGNTCFMNSAVQCLSNTPELNKYFLCESTSCTVLTLASVYKEEINRDNPLGMHGLIADAFGQVVESLWSDHPNSSFSPRQLKQYTGKFAPQFQGYGQHDTQEFIAFLLDGLHEDLNRIYKKPYIEKPDWKAGGGDLELAQLGKECWEGYKKRNDSVIVDLFQGQLMSTLICPECHKVGIYCN